jgi:hypothetical protein
MAKEVKTAVISTVVKKTKQRYAGPQYNEGIWLNGIMIRPATWNKAQISLFLKNNPDRVQWFSHAPL